MFGWFRRFIRGRGPQTSSEPEFVPREVVQALMDGSFPSIWEFLLRLSQALAEDRAQMMVTHEPDRIFTIAFEGHRTQIQCSFHKVAEPLGVAQKVTVDGIVLPYEMTCDFLGAFVKQFTRRFASTGELTMARRLACLADSLAEQESEPRKLTDDRS